MAADARWGLKLGVPFLVHFASLQVGMAADARWGLKHLTFNYLSEHMMRWDGR